MAVQAASLEILEKAAVPPAQARAIVQAIEIEIAGAKDTLATRQDILVLKQDILVLRHETSELRSDLKAEIAELRGELRAAIAGMATHNQLYTALSAQTALLLGIAYFFVSHIPH